MGDKKDGLQGSVLEEDSVKTKEPPLFKVLLHNDDYTTMEFVIEILMYVFNKSPESAAKIMMNVHQKGIGVSFQSKESKATDSTCRFMQLRQQQSDALDHQARG